MISGNAALADRASLGWLRERDIDLLFCSELHARGAALKVLEQALNLVGGEFEGAWVSHNELGGENDLIAIWRVGEGRAVVLIENKIAAPFQPDQAIRYAARASRWASDPGIVRVATMLMAPEAYFERSGAEAFEHRLSYETIFSAVDAEEDRRSAFFAGALRSGIELYRQGYVPNPDAQISAMWQVIWDTASRVAPHLRLRKPGQKPGRSWWVYFREAEGFEAVHWRNAVLVYKVDRGHIDLQFGRSSPKELLTRIRSILEPHMSIEGAGKSASIRVGVPEVDLSAAPESQVASLEAALLECERLRKFFLDHRAELLRVP